MKKQSQRVNKEIAKKNRIFTKDCDMTALHGFNNGDNKQEGQT